MKTCDFSLRFTLTHYNFGVTFTLPTLTTFKKMDFALWQGKYPFQDRTTRDGRRGSHRCNFVLQQGRTAFCARSVLALVIATQEATNKDSNDFWYSTGAKSRSDADGGQKSPVRTAPNQASRERVQAQTAHTPPAHPPSAADIPPWPRPPRARR